MKLKYTLLVLILMQLTLTGCGDLFGKKVVEKPLESGRLKADCELDMDEIAQILEKDISGTLTCLEKNLNIFIEVSELGKGGKLSRVSLVKYLKRNRPEIKSNTYAVIDGVFALSNLITGEEKDYISKKNVTLIVNLVKTFNLHAYRHYSHTFRSDKPATLTIHESHRKRVEEAAHEIQQALNAIYVADRNGEIHYLDIMKLIAGFVEADDDELLDKIDGLLFVKKIIMGGDTKTINHKELGFLFSHLPKLLSLVLDGVRYKYLKLEQKDLFAFIKEDVQDLANILFHPSRGDRRYEGLFNIDTAIDGFDRFLDEDKRIGKYRVLIKEVKKILTKSRNESTISQEEEEWVTGKDLEKMLSHVFNVTNKGLAFHKIYNFPEIKNLLDAPQSVYLDPKKYELYFPEDKAELTEFCRIINSYRYMKGSFDVAFYSLEYKRNPNGVAEIGMFEYLIKTAFGYYGSSLSMGDQQLRDILKKFETELIEMKIVLPRRTRNTAETIALLGSLFQSQSDDNKVLDVDEAAEFAISMVTAIKAKKTMYDFYLTKVAEDASNCQLDTFDRINPGCFKKYFFNGICTHYRQSFPRLFEYLGVNQEADCEQDFNTEHNLKYLEASAQAARFCHVYPQDNQEIEYSEGDIMSILLAMMHIETTITRWDKNINNTMDTDEVMDAWSIYQPAIVGMLPKEAEKLPPKMKQFLAKVIYQYLVKFEDAPKTEGKDLWKTLINLTKLIAKKAPASRKTIASILRVVSEQSKKKAIDLGEKQFACECMINPEPHSLRKCLEEMDNIPRN